MVVDAIPRYFHQFDFFLFNSLILGTVIKK